jgi:hypothetical protein
MTCRLFSLLFYPPQMGDPEIFINTYQIHFPDDPRRNRTLFDDGRCGVARLNIEESMCVCGWCRPGCFPPCILLLTRIQSSRFLLLSHCVVAGARAFAASCCCNVNRRARITLTALKRKFGNYSTLLDKDNREKQRVNIYSLWWLAARSSRRVIYLTK